MGSNLQKARKNVFENVLDIFVDLAGCGHFRQKFWLRYMTVPHRIKKECHLRVQSGDWKGVLDLDVISFSNASGIDTVSSAVSKETVPWVSPVAVS